MKYYLFILIYLINLKVLIGQNINESAHHIPPNYDQDEGFGFGLAADGNSIMIGSSAEKYDSLLQNPITAAGAVNVFKIQADSSLKFVQNITPSHREHKAGFGRYIAVSGSNMIVSSEDDQLVDTILVNRAGAIYFFKETNGKWKEVNRFQHPDKDSVISTYGWAIDMAGDYAVVGVSLHPYDENGKNYYYNGGAAYVYKKDAGGNWSYYQKLSPTFRHAQTYFGHGVAATKDIIAVSCPGNAYDTSGNLLQNEDGAVYLYKLNSNKKWVVHQMILPHYLGENHDFGKNIVFNDNQLLIADPSEGTDENGDNFIGGAGTVYVYEETNGKFNFKQKIVSPNRVYIGQFGHSISAENSLAIIGSYNERPDPNKCIGNIYYYEKTANGYWKRQAQLEPKNRSNAGRFSIEQTVLVHKRKLLASNPGQVYNGSYGGGVVFEFKPPKYADVQDVQSHKSIKIFPNPSHSSIQVSSESKQLSYQFFDINGKEHRSGILKKGEEIDIIDVPPGVYILKLNDNHEFSSHRIIVQ